MGSTADVHNSRRPSRVVRRLQQLPAVAYRSPLGRLLPQRHLVLRHVGRRSGQTRTAVLEIVRHDPGADEYLVLSIWGERADWYRNLQATPPIDVVVGGRRIDAPAHRLLDAAETRELLELARRKRPAAYRVLGRVLGWPDERSQEKWDRVAGGLRGVGFAPRGTSGG